MISPSKSSLLEGAFQIVVVTNNTVLRRCWPRPSPKKELADRDPGQVVLAKATLGTLATFVLAMSLSEPLGNRMDVE